MPDREAASERDDQARRTTAARRGVRIAGAIGATGAAVAIGVTTTVAHADGNDTTGTTTSRHAADPDDGFGYDQQRGQQQGQQLAGPGGSGPSHGHSSGS
jgi:hypothetical protein